MEPLLIGTNESIERIKGLSSEHLKILADRLKKANKGYQYLPQWRETQIVHFLKAIALHVEELGKGYAFERADLVAMSARNLLELNIWVLFCNLSADKAEHFFVTARVAYGNLCKYFNNYILKFTDRRTDPLISSTTDFVRR